MVKISRSDKDEINERRVAVVKDMPLQKQLIDNPTQLSAFKKLLGSGKEALTELFCIPDQSNQGPIVGVMNQLSKYKAQTVTVAETYAKQLKRMQVCLCFYKQVFWSSYVDRPVYVSCVEKIVSDGPSERQSELAKLSQRDNPHSPYPFISVSTILR
jgi:hypothetical protein